VRVLSAGSLGTSRGVVVTSIAYETVFLLSSGALVGCLGTVSGIGVELSTTPLYALVIPPLLAIPLLLHPRILVPVANRLLRLARREPITAAKVLTARSNHIVFLSYCLVHVLNGLAFVLVLSAVDRGSTPNVALAIGAYSLAGIAGTAAVFVPSGAGVREAVLVALLGNAAGHEQALVAAGLARLLSVTADSLLVGGLATSDAIGHFWNRRPLQRRRPV
jgi:uncharacterized membrane protein YbhN (UPF0104 family)